MFRCGQCGSTDFHLGVQPGQSVVVSYSPTYEVCLSIGPKRFVADLAFMNRYAVCKQCESVRKWQYYYPQAATPTLPHSAGQQRRD